VLSTALGTDWRANFREFEDKPTAAASIGQVHRAVWSDGRPVAVKIQYPGARQALLSDLRQLRRMAGPLGMFSPGIDVKALAVEAEARMAEELDYALEASSQQAFAAAFAGDPDITVPAVVCQAGDVLVSDWIDGVPLADIADAGTTPQRDRAGLLLVRLLLDGPARAGLMHADPHPGNFRLIPDGTGWKLGVLDFGAVSSLPDGLPEPFGRAIRLTLSGDAAGAAKALTGTGFLKTAADPAAVLDLLRPMADPAAVHTFTFSRAWLRDQAVKAAGAPKAINRRLDLPPDHLLVHRVATGTVAMLCQLGATAPFRAELIRGLPGFIEPDLAIN
jgi:predicted unusual protein kinase regulating ubiquinone biosynthesis (AarF/ABC1/UbiB family)